MTTPICPYCKEPHHEWKTQFGAPMYNEAYDEIRCPKCGLRYGVTLHVSVTVRAKRNIGSLTA